MRDPTSGRVPERAPERFLVAIEACDNGTPDLSLFLMFLGYVDLYRRKKSVWGVGARGAHVTGGRPGGVGAPSYLLASSRIF